MGPIGTNGQTIVQTFDGSAEAVEAFERPEPAKQRRGKASGKKLRPLGIPTR
ncbi:WGR domain-containing protein [Bradyrhizobium sp. CCGUVB1N3]|uniref:WGR domain-containing protein n=1 Tax=Bradyrhizobium sp. CCGUVB1N3 TaxID=2949629 RepID=UPI003531CD94